MSTGTVRDPGGKDIKFSYTRGEPEKRKKRKEKKKKMCFTDAEQHIIPIAYELARSAP